MRAAIFILTISAAVPTAAIGQTLQDQINAVYQAQQQKEEADRGAYEAQQAAILRQQREAQAAALRERQEREAAIARQRQEELEVQKTRIEAEAAEQRQKAAAAEADKKRDQSYQDKLRELAIQHQEVELEMEKAAAARANDYINSDLARRSAETDVIKSQADANRNVSSGVKDFLGHSKATQVEISAPSGE